MRRSLLLFVCLGACAPVAAAPEAPVPAATAAAPTATAVASQASAAPPAVPSSAAPAALPVLRGVSFRRVLDAPIHSVAFAPSGRVAALGSDVWLGEANALKKLPPPGPALADVRVYFGRDDQPRLMGFEGENSVYYRWRGGRWQRAVSEIGRLGGGEPAPLFGVLGNDDPEVVCKVGDACIIKRRTGWQTISPPEGRPSVTLERGTAWALYPGALLRLEADGFHAFGGALPFAHAKWVSASSDSDVWVVEADNIHHFDGKSWTRTPAPIAGLAGVWAAAPSDVWVVGKGGAAHFDGAAWSRARQPAGALSLAAGPKTGGVWLAGTAGLWRAVSDDSAPNQQN